MKASRKGQDAFEGVGADPARQLPKRLFVGELKLTDFRNYASAKLTLDPRPVLLVGDNGSGKTNLLEAVSLLGAGHGLRGRPYAELCRKDGAGGFAIAARVTSRHDEIEIGTGIAAGTPELTTGRAVRIGGKEQSAGALADLVKLVWLIPAMDGLFTGPASERRRFLDRLLLAIDPKMRNPLGRYERAMRQRNRLFQLREYGGALFGGLEEQMAEAGVAIAAARLDAVARLSALIDRTREARGDGPFPFALLSLEGTLESALGERPATEVEDEFRLRLEVARERDRAASRALEGPHLSDLVVVHGPKNAPAHHCSSGEQKALLIGLVLAKAELIKELEGVSPLVLLDEVAAHLDAARREALFAEILGLNAQAWMTGTERDLFTPLAESTQYFSVANGRVARLGTADGGDAESPPA
jgi:DNA replication and repair protein RecF